MRTAIALGDFYANRFFATTTATPDGIRVRILVPSLFRRVFRVPASLDINRSEVVGIYRWGPLGRRALIVSALTSGVPPVSLSADVLPLLHAACPVEVAESSWCREVLRSGDSTR
jgi:hypothetical protein